MDRIDENDFVLYKALSEYISENLQSSFKQVTEKCLYILGLYDKVKAKFLNEENFEKFGECSYVLDKTRKELNKLVAVQDRIDKILRRNKQRIDFLSAKLSQGGIYNDKVDKKTLQKTISSEIKNINAETLNLNQTDDSWIEYKFVDGFVFAFNNDRLDFSLEYNQDILLNANSDLIHLIVNNFPYSISKIPDEIFCVPNIKNSIIKEMIVYASNKIKKQSIKEIDREFGGILENTENIVDLEDYAEQLRNYFNVTAKQVVKAQAPELEAEIDEKLKCAESSKFLPFDKRKQKQTAIEESAETNNEKEDEDASDVESDKQTEETDEDMMKGLDELDKMLNELLDSYDDNNDDSSDNA